MSSMLVDQGIRALQSGDLETAHSLLSQAVVQTPADAKAHGYLGIVKARRGDPQGSIASLEEAARLQPTDPNARYNLAVALIQAQATDRARSALESVLTLDPNHAKARAALQQIGGSAPAPGIGGPFDLPEPSAAVRAPNQTTPAQPVGLAGYQTGGSPGMSPPQQPAVGLAGYQTAGQPGMTQPAQPMGLAGYQTAGAPGMAPPQPQPYPMGQPGEYGHSRAPISPPQYATPPPQHGMAQPPAGGMRYAPQPVTAPSRFNEPSIGLRIARGIGWGALFGQCWTFWILIRLVLLGGLTAGTSDVSGGVVAFAVGVMVALAVLFYAFLGGVVGIIIALANLDDDAGGIVGIVAGLIQLGLQVLIGARTPIGLIFGFLLAVAIGRYIGQQVATRVQQPA